MFDNARQTLNKIILKLCHLSRKKKYLSTFSFDKVSPNFRLYNGSPNTLYMYAYAARGQRHVGKQPRARREARICTQKIVSVCVRVLHGVMSDCLVDLNGTVSFSNSLLLLHCYMRPLRERACLASRTQFLVSTTRYTRYVTHQANFHL